MFVGIANTPRDYAWGSKGDIAALLHRPASGGPEAEYWLGTHPGSPSVLVGDPSRTLADVTNLPFIMKVLAADTPVSLQAHPSVAQAAEGFARENAAGIPLDAANRNYKDDRHKPELIYAVSERFEALCGFRPVASSREVIARFGDAAPIVDFLARLSTDAALPAVFSWLLGGGADVAALLAHVVAVAPTVDGIEAATVVSLDADYPGDPGILVSLLLNRVSMRAGEVIYLPAGNIHSYLHGLGIEVLASSDNVLRGGLTPKYVDVPELRRVLDFRPLPVPFLEPVVPSSGIEVFRPDVPDFELVVARPAGHDANHTIAQDAIALCVDGPVSISGAVSTVALEPGDAVYVTADEGALEFAGTGTLFLSTAQSSLR
jgi:mannose-6-phosphate isomerase